MPKFGYSRVSTKDQETSTQREILERAGVPSDNIVEEIESSGKMRVKLEQLLEELQSGDELHVVRIDRLGRDLIEACTIAQRLFDRGITFIADGTKYDPTDPSSKATFHMLATFAELERSTNRQRTTQTLASKRARGEHIGRPRSTNDKQNELIVKARADGFTYGEIQAATGVARSTAHRVVKLAEAEQQFADDPALRRDVRQRVSEIKRERAKASKKLSTAFASAASKAETAPASA